MKCSEMILMMTTNVTEFDLNNTSNTFQIENVGLPKNITHVEHDIEIDPDMD